jgi:hypothetical protein
MMQLRGRFVEAVLEADEVQVWVSFVQYLPLPAHQRQLLILATVGPVPATVVTAKATVEVPPDYIIIALNSLKGAS